MKELKATPHEVSEKYWGYADFRPMQEDIIRSVLDGNDTLGLLPTDGLAAAMCHYLQRRNTHTSSSYSGWKSFLTDNPNRVVRVKL